MFRRHRAGKKQVVAVYPKAMSPFLSIVRVKKGGRMFPHQEKNPRRIKEASSEQRGLKSLE